MIAGETGRLLGAPALEAAAEWAPRGEPQGPPCPSVCRLSPAGVPMLSVQPKGKQKGCAGCNRKIKDRYLLKALDKYWHEDCLKCACCDCRLGEVGSTLYTKANLILCRRDYLRWAPPPPLPSVPPPAQGGAAPPTPARAPPLGPSAHPTPDGPRCPWAPEKLPRAGVCRFPESRKGPPRRGLQEQGGGKP